jgi:hypothetical protein
VNQKDQPPVVVPEQVSGINLMRSTAVVEFHQLIDSDYVLVSALRLKGWQPFTWGDRPQVHHGVLRIWQGPAQFGGKPFEAENFSFLELQFDAHVPLPRSLQRFSYAAGNNRFIPVFPVAV